MHQAMYTPGNALRRDKRVSVQGKSGGQVRKDGGLCSNICETGKSPCFSTFLRCMLLLNALLLIQHSVCRIASSVFSLSVVFFCLSQASIDLSFLFYLFHSAGPGSSKPLASPSPKLSSCSILLSLLSFFPPPSKVVFFSCPEQLNR